jgi:hypothetical protein
MSQQRIVSRRSGKKMNLAARLRGENDLSRAEEPNCETEKYRVANPRATI